MLPVRVDFYLLNNDEASKRLQLACRLLEKAYLRGHSVFVYCAIEKEAQQLDELLWTYKDSSFIPHTLKEQNPTLFSPIHLGCSLPSSKEISYEILLNLSPDIPPSFSHFHRIIEIVPQHETAKEISRRHYRFYRQEKCELFISTIA